MTNALVVVIFTLEGINMTKKLLQRLLFLICLVTISVTFCSCGILSDEEETMGPPPNIKAQKNQYELYKVGRKDVTKTAKGSGNLVATRKADLFFSEAGSRIKSINIKSGQNVKKGDTLIALYTDDISDNIKFQESEIQKIQLQVDTQKSLLKKYESIPKDYQPSPKEMSDMVNNIKLTEIDLNNAKITLDGLKRKLSQAVLTAPYDGIITYMDEEIKVGDIVEAYKRIVSVSDPSSFQLSYQVPDEDLSIIKAGMKAEITYKGNKYEGIVTMAPVDYPDSGRPLKYISTALINIMKLPADAKLGETVDFGIVIKSKTNVIAIPKKALRSTVGGKAVQIMEGENKKQVNVETGIESAMDVEILSGLKEGQSIILN